MQQGKNCPTVGGHTDWQGQSELGHSGLGQVGAQVAQGIGVTHWPLNSSLCGLDRQWGCGQGSSCPETYTDHPGLPAASASPD